MTVEYGIGKAFWSQCDEGEDAVEIRIPIVLPQSARPRDLTLEIKDADVLCVRHKDNTILKWHLYGQVENEVEWRVEDEGMLLIVDLVKRNPVVWPCLLDLPMPLDNDTSDMFVLGDKLDVLFCEQHPALPKAGDVPCAKEGDDPCEADPINEASLEKLLEEAAEEVTGATTKKNMEEFIQAELKSYEFETDEIQKKLLEVINVLESAEDDEAVKQARSQKFVLEEMLRLHDIIREKRAQPTTLANFLEVTLLDIRKARVNIGEMGEEEVEEYASDAERSMTAHELMATGLMHLEKQDIKASLHFLRLAAINHDHIQSTILLYDIYSKLGSPRGPFLLLKRAMDDKNFSAAANLRVGEQFDAGARHFLPMFPAALYFYQRAAQAGDVRAMLAIAQLYLRGCTSSTMLSPGQMEGLKNLERYHRWIEQAIVRGCGSAYFVKGCMHLKGEHGCSKSYKMARELLDKATSAQPDIARRAPQVYVMLEKLRQEEEKENALEKEVAALPQTSAVEKQKGVHTESAGGGKKDNVQVSASMERLSNMKSKVTGSASTVQRPSKMACRTRSSRGFWEGAVTTTLSLYVFYTLAFPIRVLLLPHFYTILGNVLPLIPWLSAGQPPMQF